MSEISSEVNTTEVVKELEELGEHNVVLHIYW